MFTASAGHRYFLGFLGGTSFVAIPHLSLPYTHNQAEKKRGIEIFCVSFLRSSMRADLVLGQGRRPRLLAPLLI
jgi:hypothetical protein